jgi:hypothetical protein
MDHELAERLVKALEKIAVELHEISGWIEALKRSVDEAQENMGDNKFAFRITE